MRRYVVFGAIHAVLTVAGWYFVSAAAQGVADGAGLAPIWLTVLHYGVLTLMAPLGLAALALDPNFGAFELGSFVLFGFVVIVNSTLVSVAVLMFLKIVRGKPKR